MKTENETSTDLNENQVLAAQLLASGQSGKTVAKKLDVTPETISRWRKNSIFKDQVRIFLLEAREIVRQRLAGLMIKSLDVIEVAFDEEDLVPRDKFTMAFKILELCRAVEENDASVYYDIDPKQLSTEELEQIVEGKYVDLSRFSRRRR
jgi:DNA-binding CsgD family transcriptional regulator